MCFQQVFHFGEWELGLKGKYHKNLMSFENPKTFVCQQEQENNNKLLLLSSFVINYHPSETKLLITASSQRQSMMEWIGT